MASHHPSDNTQSKNLEMDVQTGSSINGDAVAKVVEINNLEDYVLMDTFNEDELEQKILKEKPTCFLIIGKPGVGKTFIAKKLAEEFKAELVSATELIKENIKLQSELGKKAQDILIKGGSVPEEVVAKMIDEKIKSNEVQHHGYVLDGFPCQSDNNFDISRQVEMLKNWKLQPDFIVNIRVRIFQSEENTTQLWNSNFVDVNFRFQIRIWLIAGLTKKLIQYREICMSKKCMLQRLRPK